MTTAPQAPHGPHGPLARHPPGPGLRVARLQLRAADAQQAARGARCIEDALRCASLPGRGAALLLVRRLALGRVDAQASTQTLALRIEARLSGITHWHDGSAADDDPQAQAVWFASRAQALAVLALRLAGQRPLQAWYWRRLLPTPPGGGAMQAPTLAATLQALAREAAAPAVLPALVGELLQRMARPALLALFTPPAAAALLRDAEIAAGDASGRAAAGTDWIAALQGPGAAGPARDIDRHPPSMPAVPARPAAAAATLTAGAGPPAAAHAAAPAAVPATAPVRLRPEHGPAAATAGVAAASQPFDLSLPTRAGGALFLLPVLARLGFAATGTPVLAARVIALALARLQLPGDDPLQALFAPRRAAGTAREPGRPTSDKMADETTDQTTDEAADEAADEALAAAWLSACRHALRRRFGIGLASLVLRPAAVVATRSHIDLHFALAATDLRVRRHGLDLDPGWLPWFGRVVAFHFDR